MAYYRCIAYCVTVVSVFSQTTLSTDDEPTPSCYSRFDFEEKLLEKMVKLQHEMRLMKDSWRKELETVGMENADIVSGVEEKLGEVKKAHQAALDDLISLGSDIKRGRKNEKLEYNKIMREIEETASNTFNDIQTTMQSAEQDFKTMYKETEAKVIDSLRDIKGYVNRTPVLVRARTLHTIRPGPEARLRFTNVLSDTAKAYNPKTGEFIAPYNGTYWFGVGLCHMSKKNVNIQVIAKEVKLTDKTLYSNNGYTCSSVHAAALLEEGDMAFVYSGRNSFAGATISQNSYGWNTFTVIMIN